MFGNCIQGMSELLNCKLDFIIAVNWEKKSYFMAIARDRLLIISEKFERVESSIEYGKIKGLVISTKVATLFRLYTDQVKEFHCLDRSQLIKVLRYSWKTDFMYKNFQFKDLPLYKYDFQSSTEVKLAVIPNMQFSHGKPRQKFKEYIFTLPQDYQPTYQDGVYIHKENPQSKIVISITELMPITLLTQIEDRANLQFYSEAFIETVIAGMEKMKEEDEKTPRDEEEESETSEAEFKAEVGQDDLEFWIIQSNPYNKRENLFNDYSEWTGWELHARSRAQDIFVIMLRRKYIPPLIESYQEILFVLYGQEQSISEQLFMNDKELLKHTLEQDIQEHSFRNCLRNTVDSLHSNFHAFQEQYLIFIKMCVNTLLYNKATLHHIYNQYKIVPQYIMYSIKYLQTFFLRMQVHDRERYDNLTNDLLSKYRFIMRDNAEFLTELLNREDNPTSLLLLFEETSFVKDKSSNEQERQNIWQHKLSTYIAGCVDGGLMNTAFNLKELVPLLNQKTVSSEIKTMITELLDYCLYIVPKQDTYTFRPGNFMKRLEQLAINKMSYNEAIAKTLIESNFFQQQLLLQEKSGTYSQLLLYFLQSENSDFIMSICKHIINFHADIKHLGGLTEQMIIAYKPIAQQLMLKFASHNRTIATLTSIALFNMCTNSREFKYIVLQNDGSKLLISKLTSKDNYLLHYTLKLIYCVMSVTQNIEKLLSNNLTDYLYKLLEGPKIKGCQYEAKCLISTCQVLQICLQQEVELKSTDHLLKLLFNLVIHIADQYFLEQEECVMLKAESILVMCKISQKSFEVKRKIHLEFVPYLLKLMQGLQIHQLQEKIVTLLCILIKENKDWALQWLEQQNQLIEILKVYHNNEISSSNYLLSQITNVRDESKRMKENENRSAKQINKQNSKISQQSAQKPSNSPQISSPSHSKKPSLQTFKPDTHSKQNSNESVVPSNFQQHKHKQQKSQQ